MKKQSQVSIFFILALIIVALGAIYLHYTRIDLGKHTAGRSEVPEVTKFIENCIAKVSETSILILGINGGYIDFPLSIETNPRSYLQSGVSSKIKNPYWWYDGLTSIPSEEFIAKQLEQNINRELPSCLDNFNPFKSEFQIKELGSVNSKITLTDKSTIIDVNYPLEINKNKNNTKITIEQYSVTMPIRLLLSYQIAKEVLEAENRDSFIEKKTIDLMVIDKEIPTTDIDASCNQKTWNFEYVKNKIKRLLSVNLPYIRILGSNYQENFFVPNPFGEDIYKDSYYQNHYIWEISDKKHPDFKFSFSYDENWPFEIDARPRDGNRLKSNSQKGLDLLSSICLHIWHFTYDIRHPVKVAITDTNEKFKPYTFSFAFKTSIDHNQPYRENFVNSIFQISENPPNEEFCNDLSHDIIIYTISNTSAFQADITGVNLTLTCGPYTCNLGKTDWLGYGAAAGINKQVPYCVNAILLGKKENYLDSQMFIQTDKSGSHTLYLKPVKKIQNYEVVKHSFENPSEKIPLSQDEKVSIQIKSLDASFETFGTYPSNANEGITLLDDSGTYLVNLYLTDNNDILGGYQGNWTISASNLANANKITFHVVEKKGSEDERALFITSLEQNSKNIPTPEIS